MLTDVKMNLYVKHGKHHRTLLEIHENWVQQDAMNNVLGFGASWSNILAQN